MDWGKPVIAEVPMATVNVECLRKYLAVGGGGIRGKLDVLVVASFKVLMFVDQAFRTRDRFRQLQCQWCDASVSCTI